jgi:hypothetical protein
MKTLKPAIAVALGLLGNAALAQDHQISQKLDSLSKEVSLLKKQTSILSNLKVSGYVQAQYQKADTLGAQSFNGGNFGKTLDNRFAVRRARIKFAYDLGFGSATLQLDATEKGVGVKNAYITLVAPFDKALSLTGGIFDRPFGYAIEYSSSAMEVVERPIVYQMLFPGEQDLGAMLAYAPSSDSPLKGLVLKAGLFNGNGINTDVDKYKDLIAKISYSGFNLGKAVNLNVGASAYLGNVYNPTASFYEMVEESGVKGFKKETKEVGAKNTRRYLGFDAQLSVKTPIGKTQLVSEYLFGKQPGSAASSKSPDYSVLPAADGYLREFSGFYATLIQQIYKVSVFGRYEVYDPNTKIEGNQIGMSGSGLKEANAADLKLHTTSLGSFYEPTRNIRITAQYDFNRAEKTDNGKFSVAGLSCNVFTLRLQYKF